MLDNIRDAWDDLPAWALLVIVGVVGVIAFFVVQAMGLPMWAFWGFVGAIAVMVVIGLARALISGGM